MYPVRGAQVPNTRDEPSDAVDEKIMAWGQNLKELSKETKLKLEKDANADEEAKQAADELYPTPAKRVTTFGLRQETQFLETETPGDRHGDDHYGHHRAVSIASVAVSDAESRVAPSLSAVSRRTSDAHSTAHSTAYGSGSEASDVDHHSETASVARLLPPPRAQSLPQSESAVPEKRKRVSADGVRARGTHKEAKGRGARNPPDILANKGKEKDKPRQWGQKARVKLRDADFDFQEYFSDSGEGNFDNSDVLGQSMSDRASRTSTYASEPASPRFLGESQQSQQSQQFGQHLSVTAAMASRRSSSPGSRSILKSMAGSRRGRRRYGEADAVQPTRSTSLTSLEATVGSPAVVTTDHDLEVEDRVSMVVTV